MERPIEAVQPENDVIALPLSPSAPSAILFLATDLLASARQMLKPRSSQKPYGRPLSLALDRSLETTLDVFHERSDLIRVSLLWLDSPLAFSHSMEEEYQ
jgi:hypothetical protein